MLGSDSAILVKATAFVVATDDELRAALGEALRACGVGRVTGGADSAAAFSDVQRLRPDLLVVETRARPLDGFALANLLRSAAGDHGAQVPLLLVAERVTAAEVQQARALDGDLLLLPLLVPRLRARLLRRLRARPSQPTVLA